MCTLFVAGCISNFRLHSFSQEVWFEHLYHCPGIYAGDDQEQNHPALATVPGAEAHTPLNIHSPT